MLSGSSVPNLLNPIVTNPNETTKLSSIIFLPIDSPYLIDDVGFSYNCSVNWDATSGTVPNNYKSFYNHVVTADLISPTVIQEYTDDIIDPKKTNYDTVSNNLRYTYKIN